MIKKIVVIALISCVLFLFSLIMKENNALYNTENKALLPLSLNKEEKPKESVFSRENKLSPVEEYKEKEDYNENELKKPKEEIKNKTENYSNNKVLELKKPPFIN